MHVKALDKLCFCIHEKDDDVVVNNSERVLVSQHKAILEVWGATRGPRMMPWVFQSDIWC